MKPKVHYGQSRAACGRYIHRLTNDPRLVTCLACKRSPEYAVGCLPIIDKKEQS